MIKLNPTRKGRLILDLGSAWLASAAALSKADSASAHREGLCYAKYEVLRWEGRGWVNS